jgi:hypothetical protein
MKENMSWDLWALGMLCALVIFGGIYTLFDDFIYGIFVTFINKVMSSIILTNMLLGAIGLILILTHKGK